MGIPKNGIPQRYTKIIMVIPNYGYTKKKSQKLWLYGIPGITIIWLYCFTLVRTNPVGGNVMHRPERGTHQQFCPNDAVRNNAVRTRFCPNDTVRIFHNAVRTSKP